MGPCLVNHQSGGIQKNRKSKKTIGNINQYTRGKEKSKGKHNLTSRNTICAANRKQTPSKTLDDKN
uniref:Uncharacterized protein n=1 Tax=Manihot esculenta TaxID=3983 RepID=A0A2C9V0D9_MANES